MMENPKTKKELKAAYKQMKFPIGVFQIRNKTTGKILVDGSTNMNAKWNRHLTQLRFKSHRNTTLQNDWNKYGADDFVFEVLSEIDQSDEKIMDYEQEVEALLQLYLEDLNPFHEPARSGDQSGGSGYNKKRKQ